MDESERHVNCSPVSTANPISKLFFWWLNPLFREGYKRKLGVNDMYNVVPEDSSEFLCERLQKNWEKEKTKIKYGKKPSLRNATLRTFGAQLAIYGIIVFIEEATKVVQPLLLGGLIRYFTPGSGVTKFDAYILALGLSLCAIMLAISHHPYFYMMQRIGMRIRIASCSLIYQKALRLSNGSLGKTTTGHIVNLLSNDVNRFDLSTLFLHFLWVGPLQAIAVLVILWIKLGVASLAGFSVLLLLIPLQSYMGKLFSKLRRKTAVETDQRVKIMNEILTGIRVIKMYCWEKLFGDLVRKVRKSETIRIHYSMAARSVLVLIGICGAKMLVYMMVLAWILPVDGRLDASILFPAMALYQQLRSAFFSRVSMAVQYTGEAMATLRRVQDFLLLEELEDSTITRGEDDPDPKDCKVTSLDMTGTWDKTTGLTTLSDVSFEVKSGELLAVIGPVGAGKSSLLMGILGGLPLEKGNVKVTGKLAYAAQQPWIFSASVRQNIIFGQKFHKDRYERCIKASALAKDLEIMPNHDQTLIGERGVSLSGGQKARISLARALYTESDIYLLDDPLSAVDTAVGRHLFEKCICGMLKNKPRILVTHQLQYLKTADKILILKEGIVLGMGTYNELLDSGIDFAALLKKDDDNDMKENCTETSPEKTETPNLRHKNLLGVKELNNYLSQSYDPSRTLLKDSIRESEDREKLMEPDVKVELKKSRLSKSLHSLSGRNTDRNSMKVRSQISVVKSVDNLAHGIGSTLSLDDHICPDFIAPVQEEEHREQGKVGSKIYWRYFQAGANGFGLLLLLLLNIVAQVTYMMADWWLSYWSVQQQKVDETNRRRYMHDDQLEAIEGHRSNATISQNSSLANNAEPEELMLDKDFYIAVYSAITAGVFIFGMVRALFTFHILVNAAKTLHHKMFKSVVRCPVLFFDTNPVGRILNRFSKDQGTCDELLPMTMFDFIQCSLMISGIVILAGVINPWVFIPTLPLAVMFFYLRRYFLRTSRDVKRLEATTRSPVFSHLSATLQGLHTIRAHKSELIFTEEFHRHQDLHTEAWSLFLSTSRWFAIRLDWLCVMFVTSVAFCSVLAAGSLNGGLVGLTMTYAINLMGLFQWGVRQSAEVENQMTSVERVIEYSALTPEAPLESTVENKPPKEWPKHGIISGEGATFRYTKDGPVVLKGINFCVRSSEKVGIAGRTGAGKSSLISMLFRLAEPEGLVMVDGINIKTLGLHDLRGIVSIIPQDPVLFTGTVRKNLDPFNLHTDEQVWNSLEEVQLKPAVVELPKGLEAEVSEGGVNFSVGQRQLICLARAILRQNKILVMDEATANVDPRTDSLIQETIRRKFKNCTVLTIAHRLHTIMDSDRVMVFSEGKIVEFEEPYALLQNKDSYFYKMVEQTGKAESDRLLKIAQDVYNSARCSNKSDIQTQNGISR